MPDCAQTFLNFPSFDRRKIEASFTGGNVSSDGGLMLLRQADRRLGLTRALDAVLHDPRNPDLITHRQIDLLRQRIFGLAAGYEELNDHDTLRNDLLWQSAVDCESELASSPTLCRLENRADRQTACMATRRDAISTATTATGVSCRSTSSAANNCSAPICDPVISTRPITLPPFSQDFSQNEGNRLVRGGRQGAEAAACCPTASQERGQIQMTPERSPDQGEEPGFGVDTFPSGFKMSGKELRLAHSL